MPLNLPRLVTYDKIKRGKLYNVAVPHMSERPLSFVIEDDKNPGTFNLVTKPDGFEGKRDPKTGKKFAPTLKVVTEFKLRPSLVIQNDKLNTDPNYHSIVVLPVATIYESDKENPLISRAIEKNDIDLIHYIGAITGREAYIQVNNPKLIHKNLLFEPDYELLLPDIIITDTMKKFAKCFEIKQIKECEECQRNCNNCEYKIAVNK